MKKISFIALLSIAFVCLNSCEENIPNEYGIPSKDTTMLWPAQTDTSALWGYINERGEMVIPTQYINAAYYSGGKACVILENRRYAFINRFGQALYTLAEGEICSSFYYGYSTFCDYKEVPPSFGFTSLYGFYGMLDSNFNVVIPKEYNGLGTMSKEGLVSYSVVDAEGHHKYGFLNKHGKTVIAPQDGYVLGFYDGVSVKELDGKFGAINTKGKWVIDTIYDVLASVGEDRLVYGEREYYRTYGLMDTKGRKITEPIFRDCAFYGEGGLMPIMIIQQGGWGYMDKNGVLQIPCQYKTAEPFCEGVAWTCKSEYNLIDLQGNVLISLEKNQKPCGTFHNGLCLICERNGDYDDYYNSYQYINKQGEVVYRWTPYSGGNDAPELQKPARLSEDEMLLKHFEGTEYYPLAEQCAKRMRERENIKNN